MRIAALIQAYKYPGLVADLVDRLSTPLWRPYLHIDRKADIRPYLHISDRAVLLNKREPIYWGGANGIKVTLRLLDIAHAEEENTHFYLMSGQCFTIKSDEDIAAYLGRRGCAGNFMHSDAIPTIYRPLDWWTQWHFNDFRYRYVRGALWRLRKYLPKRNVDRLLRGIPIYGGLAFWMLNREAVGKVLDFASKNPWYLRAFKYTLIPDEFFFQTLVNHLSIPLDGSCPTATKWTPGKPHPWIITPEILNEFTGDWHFAARKFEAAPDFTHDLEYFGTVAVSGTQTAA
jgi:hypothetical protein